MGPPRFGGGRLLRLLGALAGLALLALLVARTGPSRIAEVLSGLRLPLVALSLSLFAPIFLVKALKWRILVSAAGAEYPLRASLRASLEAYGMGYVTPGRVGEFVRADAAARSTGAAFPKLLATVLADRIGDLFILFAAALLAAAALLGPEASGVGAALALSSLGFLAGATVALTAPERLLSLVGRVPGLGGPASRFLRAASDLRQALVARPAALVAFLALTALAWGLVFAQYLVIAVAVGVHAPLAAVLVAVPVSLVLEALPISVGGLGTRDAGFVVVLGLAGAPPEEALAYSLALAVHGLLLAGPAVGVHFLGAGRRRVAS